MEPDKEYFSQPHDSGLARSKARIASACEDLFFVSETDAPVEPVEFPNMTELSPAALREALDRGDEEPVKSADATEFFDRLTRPQEWHIETEKEVTRRFLHLRDVMENELEDIHLFRVGKVQVEIFVIGRTPGGTIAGVRTRAVET